MIDWSVLDRQWGPWWLGPFRRRHKRIAVSFSGGKDSTLVLWLMREAGLLGRVTVYHMDPGDLFPEMVKHVAEVASWCPRFVHLTSDARAWAREHGEPSDLVPYSAHYIGQYRADGAKIAGRFDCCVANLMRPLHERIEADGNTLLIRGTRRSDQPKLPVASGVVFDGIEHFYPIQEWTDDEVLDFCRRMEVPLPALYDHFRQGPECATCPAWWGVDNAPYLKARHPKLYAEYEGRVAGVMRELNPCLAHLKALLAGFEART